MLYAEDMKSKANLFCRALCIYLTFVVSSSVAAGEEKTFRIGVLLPLTGEFASYGEIIRKAIEQRPPRGVTLLFEDSKCNPAQAVTAYNKLVNINGVSLFVGPPCGSEQKALAPLVKKSNQVMMLTNSSPAALYANSNGKMFMPQYSIEDEAKFNAAFLNAHHSERVVILYIDNEYSRAHEAPFAATYHGSIIERIRLPNWNVDQIKSAVLKLKSLNFDSVYVPDAAPFLSGLMTEAAKIHALDGKRILSVFSLQMDDILKREGLHAEGVLYSYPALADDQDAIGYFGVLAMDMMADTTRECEGRAECVRSKLTTKYSFDSNGVLRGKIILKTILQGRFTLLNEGSV
jgi:ABC-type branched-subunit amino acid transport system substrate-binding protein